MQILKNKTMATNKKAPTIKATKKATQKKVEKVQEQPDETEKIYDEESLPEESIVEEELSIAEILKRNKKN